jgi:hypothetical protein
MVTIVFLLLCIYQAKHFLADYPLQTGWMLGKFARGWKWIPPLAAHAGVHAFLTFLIAYAFSWHPGNLLFALQMAGVDGAIHFLMDRIKASPNLLGRFKPLSPREYPLAAAMGDTVSLRHNRLFWYSLGLDQMVHHLTHYYIIWQICQRM